MSPPPPGLILSCPACKAALSDPSLCAACGSRHKTWRGLTDFVLERQVAGTDRLMRTVYNRLGRLHDPALRHILAPIDGFDEEEIRAAILDLFNPEPTGLLLDAGCGTGQELIRLAKRLPQARFVGIDLSRGMMKQGQQNLEQAGVQSWLAMADVHALPFADDSFDGVLHVGAVNNFRDKSLALSELLRVCKPGAPVVIVDEQLDPDRPHSPIHRLAFQLLTWYDREPQVPLRHLPASAEHVVVRQITRFYYALTCRKAG